MNTHKNARLTPYARQSAIRRVAAGVPVAEVARALGVSRQTIYKWLRRGVDVTTRTSRPHGSPTRLPRFRRRQILKRRRQRWSGVRIAQYYQLPLSTVGRELRRHGLGRLPRVEPPRRIVRYERDRPGELVHLDVKKLGRIGRVGHRIHGDYQRRARGGGWEYVHVAIDDHTRLAYVEVLADETAATAAAFLVRAVAWYAALGIMVERVLTDNGSCYRALPFAEQALTLGIGQRFTRPYRPQTNSKAERFIRTLLTEWAYVRAYGRSHWRTRALAPYLSLYNTERRHTAIGHRPPAARLASYLSTTCQVTTPRAALLAPHPLLECIERRVGSRVALGAVARPGESIEFRTERRLVWQAQLRVGRAARFRSLPRSDADARLLELAEHLFVVARGERVLGFLGLQLPL